MEGSLNLKSFSRRLTPIHLALLLALAISSFSITGCARTSADSDAVAKVNGTPISRSEMEKYFNNKTTGAPKPVSGAQADSLRLNILNELIDQEIKLQRAQKLGLLTTDEEVNTKINELKAPYTQEEFDKRLKEKNLTLDDLKREMRRNLTIDKLINKEITSKITVTDADITNYYNDHKAEFNLIEPQYHLAHILVTTHPNPQVKSDKAQNEAAAKQKIQQIQNRLESGEDFSDVAAKYSEDPETSSNGGDLGFVPEQSLKNTDPATREAISKLASGHISSIITVTAPGTHQVFGYRIVKLLAKEPAGQRELNDPRVQQSIREQLRQTREQLLTAAYYETLRDQARVENYLAENILKDKK